MRASSPRSRAFSPLPNGAVFTYRRDVVPVVISGDGFGPVPAMHARRFRDRLVGMRSDAVGRALLIDAASIHTLGMGRSIAVVGLDGVGRVLESRVVKPNRVVWLRRAKRILELAAESERPATGSVLRVRND